MAGIGFTLKKLFREETFTNRSKAYLYSTLVAAGPWIAAVITVNAIILLMGLVTLGVAEKELFMGTIVYCFVFSQILTGPWQMIITRFVADKLYTEEYAAIRPSFNGLSKITATGALLGSVAFYYGKPLPLYYKMMGGYLFILISLIWILMVYLSAVKDYELIGRAYILGGILSVVLTLILIYYPLPFPQFTQAANLLFAYVTGMSLTFFLLAYNFLSTFYIGNHQEYDFLRYLNRLPSLFFVGLFYVSGLWIDDLIMWFSPVGVEVYQTYLYAPIYDNAVFLAYLTIIPSMVMFMVSVETEVYEHYKKYYGLVNHQGTYQEIEAARQEMKLSIYRRLWHTFQIQTLISVTILLLSAPLFDYFNINIIIRDIFRVAVLGALFNIITFLIILVLLYFEVRVKAMLIAFGLFVTNLVLTWYLSGKGLEYYGWGFTLSSLSSLLVAIGVLTGMLKQLNFKTFGMQPAFVVVERGLFVWLADRLNAYQNRGNQHGILAGQPAGASEVSDVRSIAG